MKPETVNELVKRFDYAVSMGASDAGHASAIAIHDVLFKGNDKKWNTQSPANDHLYTRGLIALRDAGKIYLRPEYRNL